jgi:hypothetical protein
MVTICFKKIKGVKIATSKAKKKLFSSSRPGFFSFAISNGSLKACQATGKLSINVSSTLPPEVSPMPPELPQQQLHLRSISSQESRGLTFSQLGFSPSSL